MAGLLKIIKQPSAQVKQTRGRVACSLYTLYNGIMAAENKKPIIVGFVSDLLFNVQIANVATRLNYDIRWVESQADISPHRAPAPEEPPGELLHGQGGALFARLSKWQPALLIFDLTNEDIPWRHWIAAIKSSAATRRIPVLCFGPHVDTEAIKEAKSVGADVVVARSRFSSAMPQLIQQHARRPDVEAVAQACDEPLDARARTGIALFNEGQFYKCHDALEEAWVADASAGRDLYRAILQVGIAYFQIERGNYRGAVKMLLRVRQWLAPLPDVCRGVNIARLRQDVENVHQALETLGPEGLDAIDRSLFRRIETVAA